MHHTDQLTLLYVIVYQIKERESNPSTQPFLRALLLYPLP